MENIIITRHPSLVEYLIKSGYVSEDTPVFAHASSDIVSGNNVWGVLPHNLSCLCNSFTEVPLQLTPEMRGVELSLEDIEKVAGKPVTYKVKIIS